MAGLSSPIIVLAFAGSLLGVGMLFIFPLILWSYHNINLTNMTIVISCMESLGFPVGSHFDCGCYVPVFVILFYIARFPNVRCCVRYFT